MTSYELRVAAEVAVPSQYGCACDEHCYGESGEACCRGSGNGDALEGDRAVVGRAVTFQFHVGG